MKKEVIVSLIVFLLVLAPIASADNFLAGSSIFDKFEDVYAKSVDFLKGLFAKGESVVGLLCRMEGQTQTRNCNTNLLGMCSGGTQTRTCIEDGNNFILTEWSQCIQNVNPGEREEQCDNQFDDDCDGLTDDQDDNCQTAGCGNEIIEEGEDCEFERIEGGELSENLNGQTCESLLGLKLGTLSCSNDCTFNTQDCREEIISCPGGHEDGSNWETQCSAGVGECRRIGIIVNSCIDGRIRTSRRCNAVAGQSSIEICNDNKDNDCDGLTDDQDENDCRDQSNVPPAPTNLQYQIARDNKLILTWDNVLGRNDATGGTGAVTGYVISENNFFDRIIFNIKKLFNKNPVGTLERKYSIYKINMIDGRNQVEIIGEINENECRDACVYEYTHPSRGDRYVVKSIVNGIRSLSSNLVGPIANICGDGIIYGNEQCEGNNLDGKTCQILGYSSGQLSCSNDCTFNIRNCIDMASSCQGLDGINYNIGQTEQRACSQGIGTCQKQGAQARTCQGNDLAESGARNQGGWSEWSQCSAVPEAPSQEICGNSLDDDCDGFIDSQDSNCKENTYQNGCFDTLDNDNDNIIDNLDLDCRENNGENGLKIKAIKSSAKEVYSSSRMIIEGYYEIPLRTPQEVSQCVNLTLNDVEMICQQKSPQQNLIRYAGCDVGSEGSDKIIKISVMDKCNSHPEFTFNRTYINVTEFTTCESGKVLEELLNQIEIIKPGNNEKFRHGESIPIKVKVTNDGDNDMEITVSASLMDSSLEEIETSDSATKEITSLHDEIFYINITVPLALEKGEYQLYIKAYEDYNEEGLCNSNKVNIKVDEARDNMECERNQDCSSGFVCEDGECTSLSCNPPLILSIDGHSCIARGQEGQENNGQGSEGNLGGTSDVDGDYDGLPDYWEYNYFGGLSQGPDDDPDNDNISNLDEYRFNTNPKVQDKSRSSFGTWMTIIIFVILIAAVAFFIIRKLKNRGILSYSRAADYSLNPENQDKLKAYIQNAKAGGMKKQDIKNNLINAGWKDQDIGKFL